MKSILEITTKGGTLYEFSDDVFPFVEQALRRGLFSSVSEFVKTLPPEWDNLVVVHETVPNIENAKIEQDTVVYYDEAKEFSEDDHTALLERFKLNDPKERLKL